MGRLPLLAFVLLAAGAAAADPPLTLRGMTFVSSQGSIHRVVVEAATAVLYPDTNLVELEGGVHAQLEGSEGSESLDLRCESVEEAGSTFTIDFRPASDPESEPAATSP